VYHSDESGPTQVYVQPFPGPGGKWQVSSGGGSAATWSRDGKEILYVGSDGKLMATAVKTTPDFEAGVPAPLFDARLAVGPGRQFDVSSDAKRFLLNRALGDEASAPITLVLNWTAELKR
jgi:hypothetical protein